MKTLLALMVALVSLSTFACPDLTGKYICEGKENIELEVSQNIEDGVTTYILAGLELVADKTERKIGDIAELKELSYAAACRENMFLYILQGKYVVQEGVKLSYVGIYANGLDEDGNFIEVSKLQLGARETQPITRKCVRVTE